MKRTAGNRQPELRSALSSDLEDAKPRRLRRSESTCDGPARKARQTSRIEQPPRTVEVLWDGRAAPGFTLKRKRSGAILVSTVSSAVAAVARLRVGSELRLVGGFPVARLTLADVKKVMLCAPKPVSLVFVNADALDVLVHSDSSASSDDEHARNDTRLRKESTVSVASSSSSQSDAFSVSTSASSRSLSVASASDSSAVLQRHHRHHRQRRLREREGESASGERDAASKKRKVSRLQVTLDRVNQLLNRPVRQSGLNIPASQSIVV